jgi:hypothetical protein
MCSTTLKAPMEEIRGSKLSFTGGKMKNKLKKYSMNLENKAKTSSMLQVLAPISLQVFQFKNV